MELNLDRESCVPVYQQIARKIKERILSQKLTAGFKLPAERRLAEELGVHRNTVIKAYDVLIQEGLVVVSRNRPKGYFVEELQEPQNFSKRFFPLEKAFRYEFRRAEKRFNDIYWKSEAADVISFGGMIMDRNLDPVETAEKVTAKLFDSGAKDYMTRFAEETQRLRENICRILTRQNIYVTPKNVQLLAESNQVISYLITLYLREGDCVIAEEPMVPDNYSIFYNRGINIITVPMEADGMRMDVLEECIRQYKPKFIYTQPNYHNPTGITMSLKKRRTLLRLADSYNIPIIEEDYLQDFSYTDQSLPSLYALDANKLVIYVYSYTLIFPYLMKLSYAVARLTSSICWAMSSAWTRPSWAASASTSSTSTSSPGPTTDTSKRCGRLTGPGWTCCAESWTASRRRASPIKGRKAGCCSGALWQRTSASGISAGWRRKEA